MAHLGRARVTSSSGLLVLEWPGQSRSGQRSSLQSNSTGPWSVWNRRDRGSQTCIIRPQANQKKAPQAEGPLGRGGGALELGVFGFGVAGAVAMGETVEPAEHLDGPLERMEPPRPVVTDVHHPAAGRALPIQDVELPQG